jgi:hypothetical protein
MDRYTPGSFRTLVALLVGATTVLGFGEAWAQCTVPELTSGLRFPLGITESNQGGLVVGETGTPGIPNSGRLSIVGLDGTRRTLLDGLPSGTNDVGDPSGPAGVFMRGRTLYVVIGIGDSGVPGPLPLTLLANPHPSSPLFSSVLAVHFSAAAEKGTAGFLLTPADHSALADGQTLQLSNGSGDRVTVELLANLPDSTPAPIPDVPLNVRGSNPFDLVALGDHLYVTDGGQNLVWDVDAATGGFGVLTTFPQVLNPLPFGPPATDAVPTGIRVANGDLLVTLLTGFPFAPGTSTVERIHPATGAHSPVVTGLTTAIDVIPVEGDQQSTGHLVLQFASEPVLGGAGQLINVAGDGVQTLGNGCLNHPSSMTRDRKTGTLFVTEIVGGRVVIVP